MLDKRHADRRENLFGGEGAVHVWDLLPGPLHPFSAVLGCELDPGGSVGRHSQQRDPEIVVCISGEGVATVGAREHELRTGSAVGLPFGETLALRNTSDTEPLRYLIIKAQVPPSEGRPSLLL